MGAFEAAAFEALEVVDFETLTCWAFLTILIFFVDVLLLIKIIANYLAYIGLQT